MATNNSNMNGAIQLLIRQVAIIYGVDHILIYANYCVGGGLKVLFGYMYPFSLRGVNNMKYEYKQIYVIEGTPDFDATPNYPSSLEADINILARKGWKIISCVPVEAKGLWQDQICWHILAQRPKIEQQEKQEKLSMVNGIPYTLKCGQAPPSYKQFQYERQHLDSDEKVKVDIWCGSYTELCQILCWWGSSGDAYAYSPIRNTQ